MCAIWASRPNAGDPEFVASLPLSGVRWVLSAVRDRRTIESLLATLREQGYRGRIAVVAYTEVDAQRVEGWGVDTVIRPYRAAAQEAAQSLLAT